ncbi:hypothetical protein HLI_04135 [Halobacillus litoralis]|uniref:Uncharacterized protein n=1 Tax=Halobacillus litoralis TaxID=45668 RepID=A0A410M9U5_9BACI|nr:hypothetical protein HLI_04135 [Halobacillus litoralis]
MAFRFTDEMKSSSLLELASKARTNYFGKDDKSWYLYKMAKSEFLDWYDNQPGPGRDLYDIQHHIISTSETTFEILCKYEPRINIVEKNT